MTAWLIVPCSGAKRPDAELPASARYTGTLHRLTMRAALALVPPERVRIQSARYGLLALDDRTTPYDMRVGELSRDDDRAFRSKIHVEACSMYWADGRRPGYEMEPVLALVPAAYAEALAASPLLARSVVRPLDGCRGIGDMRHRLAALAEHGWQLDEPWWAAAAEAARSTAEPGRGRSTAV